MSDRNIRFGQLIEVSADKGPYKTATFRSDGKKMDAKVIEPYGVQGQPVKDGLALILIPDGDEGRAVAIVMPPPKDRVDGQAEGELTFIDHKTGSKVRFDKSGNIEITPKGGADVKIKAAKVTIEADIEITGNITMTGNFTQSGVHVDSNGPH